MDTLCILGLLRRATLLVGKELVIAQAKSRICSGLGQRLLEEWHVYLQEPRKGVEDVLFCPIVGYSLSDSQHRV